MESRTFSQWTLQDLRDTFALKRHTAMPSLTDWLEMGGEIVPPHRATLEKMRERVSRNSAHQEAGRIITFVNWI